jgi:aminopeptidase N
LWLAALLLAMPGRASPADFQIAHYDVRIEPDFAKRAITARATLRLIATTAQASRLALDAGALQIDSVQENERPVPYRRAEQKLLLSLPPATHAGQVRELVLSYHGTPTDGLQFSDDGAQVSTAFSTSQWMPCQDAPSQRATLALTLVLPPGMAAVANGSLEDTQALPTGKVASRWLLRQPMPSYLFGFVAGEFRVLSQTSGATTLRFMAPPGFSADQLRQVFRDSADMLRFFEARAGVPYPFADYTQVLLRGAAAQEMSGFSVMGERYGQRVLQDATRLWLGAHEFSHQWWGNGLTNRSWEHFWLNEGIASFMTAAYLEHRFGASAYQQQIDAARAKYEALRQAGHDKSLVFANWDAPTAEDRSLVYDKGAYVTHLLRQHLGEQAFWDGLRAYTRQYWGQSVQTADFQHAMEQSSGRDLSDFFDRWVYLQSIR